MISEWNGIVSRMCNLLLNWLWLGLENGQCPMGCCRLVKRMMEQLIGTLRGKPQFPMGVKLITNQADEGEEAQAFLEDKFEGYPIELQSKAAKDPRELSAHPKSVGMVGYPGFFHQRFHDYTTYLGR